MYDWSLTQSLNVTQQLEAGIRYFDIRLSLRLDVGGLYIVHGLYGMAIQLVLQEIASFLDHHCKEVVLLDFNHLYDMTEELHKKFLAQIKETFGSKLCPNQDISAVTLQNLWKLNQQVLVCYHHPLATHDMLVWPGDVIMSPWPNQTSSEKLLHILEKNYELGAVSAAFYVTQGVLTPDVLFVIEHIESSLYASLCQKVAEPVVQWLTKKQAIGAGKRGINICILDYVQLAKYTDIVLALNQAILPCSEQSDVPES